MKTVKEIELQLQATNTYESWILELQQDTRAGVQQALKRWEKRQQKLHLLQQQFEEKMAFDQSYLSSPQNLLAGVDEAGRGPLAGPVVTAAVILPKKMSGLFMLDDSKKLTARTREQLAELIRSQALAYAVHIQPAKVIDDMNIYRATEQSMRDVVLQLQLQPDVVLADAMALALPYPSFAIVKGDEKSLAIAAASILAKTTRDAYMKKLHEAHPQYGFESNAGYGTATHLQALHQFGPCDEHRRTFEPVKSIVMERE